MLKLKSHTTEPRGGWHYKHPKTHLDLRANCWQNLLRLYRQHSMVNNYPIPDDFEAIIEDEICHNTALEFVDVPDGMVFLGCPTIDKVLKTADRLKAMVGDGVDILVDNQVYLSRTNACIACPRNNPTVCLVCDGYDVLLRRKFKLPEHELDRRLMACACDHTPLMVWCRLKSRIVKGFGQTLERIPYPDNCWKNRLETTHE